MHIGVVIILPSTTRRCFSAFGCCRMSFLLLCAHAQSHVCHTQLLACAPCRSHGHRHAHSHCTISMIAHSHSCLIEEHRYSILSHGLPEYSLLYLRSAIDKRHRFSVTSLAWTTLSTDHAHHWASSLPCIVPMHNTFSYEKNRSASTKSKYVTEVGMVHQKVHKQE